MKIFLCVLVFILLGGWGIWHQAFGKTPSAEAVQIMVTIPEGTTFTEVNDILARLGLTHGRGLSLFARLSGADRDVRAGNFVLKPGMNYKETLRALRREIHQDVTVTIPEGFTLRQIGERLEALGFFSVAAWEETVGSLTRPAQDVFRDSPLFVQAREGASLEGYLFPDTYRFASSATPEVIAQRLLTRMEEMFSEDLRAEARAQERTIEEVVILASILEREVRSEGDRARVSDLFLRRLEAGMPLQADSTVNYVTGKNDPGISLADRDRPSPWNTYLNPGLPQGPISNPGLVSLRAALFPEANDAWYFLTDPEGGVHYATTFEEHIVNRGRYLE